MPPGRALGFAVMPDELVSPQAFAHAWVHSLREHGDVCRPWTVAPEDWHPLDIADALRSYGVANRDRRAPDSDAVAYCLLVPLQDPDIPIVFDEATLVDGCYVLTLLRTDQGAWTPWSFGGDLWPRPGEIAARLAETDD